MRYRHSFYIRQNKNRIQPIVSYKWVLKVNWLVLLGNVEYFEVYLSFHFNPVKNVLNNTALCHLHENKIKQSHVKMSGRNLFHANGSLVMFIEQIMGKVYFLVMMVSQKIPKDMEIIHRIRHGAEFTKPMKENIVKKEPIIATCIQRNKILFNYFATILPINLRFVHS